MRRWVVLTLLRLAGGLLLAAIVWIMLVRLPAGAAMRTIKNQPRAAGLAAAQLAAAQNQLSDLPLINNVTVGHPDSFRNYAGQVNTAAKAIKAIDIGNTCPRHIIGLSRVVSDTDKLSSDSCRVFELARSDVQASNDLAAYHAKVCGALINILDYDPTADTAAFSLGAADTSQRLQLAAQGLAKAKATLNSLRGTYKDNTLTDIIDIVSSLQQARDDLAKTGDTANWIAAVSQAQAKIVDNQSKFWLSSSSAAEARLNKDSNQFLKNQQAWSILSSKYRV
jgi:hypothetical protein